METIEDQPPLCLLDDHDEDIIPTGLESEEHASSDTEVEQDEYPLVEIDIGSDEIEDETLKPIYEKATMSLCAAYCAILEFKRSCQLPFTTIKKLLDLLQLLCPADNVLPKSVYQFKKFFLQFSSPVKKHQFCPNCKLVIERCTCDSLPSEPDSLITLDAETAIARVVKSKLL